MRPWVHVFLVVLLPELALLTSQFQVGCDGPCSGGRAVVASLTLPLVGAWIILVATGVYRLIRARTR
jgi:hypothetical protein